MKQLTCEMCGSTDLMKQDGVFVCQSCGTKYSVEEAKKMMVEGTVEVEGTVKIDDSTKIENYYKMAEHAYQACNYKEAEQYCNKIIEIDGTYSVAWLLKGIISGWQSTSANLRMDEFISCVSNAFTNATDIEILNSLAKRAYREYYNLTLAINELKVESILSYPMNCVEYLRLRPIFHAWALQIQLAYVDAFNNLNKNESESEKKKSLFLSQELGLDDIDEKCNEELIRGATKLWDTAFSDYNSASDGYPTDHMLDRMMEEGSVAIVMLEHTIPKDLSEINEKEKTNVINACKELIRMNTSWINLKSYTVSFSNGVEFHPVSKFITMESKREATAKIRKCHERIKACDPTYDIPEVKEPIAQVTQVTDSGGCYVATAVYGSYDCPQVWTLRRFRDYTLAETWYGRAFIRTYYAISPTLVKWFGHTDWFKNMWKGRLDQMVAALNAEGVEDTPYEDRKW